MNEDSLPLCEEIARPGALMLINSSLVRSRPKRSDLRVVLVPCVELAEEIGDAKIANVVMMGALSQATGAVKLDHLEDVLKSFFSESKHRYIPLNIKAIEAGKRAVED
jgi:2-oxoglutarate ferredoxin oxidoreductase subunit gamma